MGASPPPGHTGFSWWVQASCPIPCSHTAFSWGSPPVEASTGAEVFLVHLAMSAGKVGQHKIAAGSGVGDCCPMEEFRGRRPIALLDGPMGLSMPRRKPPGSTTTLWHLALHSIVGGSARFSLQSCSTGRFLRETEEGIVSPCIESGGVIGGWDAPSQAIVGPSRGLYCKVKSSSTGRYLSLIPGPGGKSTVRTTSDRRTRASDVSFLFELPPMAPVWAFDGRSRRHVNVDPSTIVESLATDEKNALEEAHSSQETEHDGMQHGSQQLDPRFAGYLDMQRKEAVCQKEMYGVECSKEEEVEEEEEEEEEEAVRELRMMMMESTLNAGGANRRQPQVVIVVRHGLSVANMQRDTFGGDCDESYIDASLSPMGRRQAEAIGTFLKGSDPQICVCSPLRRALQTCLYAFEGMPYAPPILLMPFLTECVGNGLENNGREKAEIERDVELRCFRHWPSVDSRNVGEGAWWEREREMNQDAGGRRRQARSLKHWIEGRAERRIMVVAHWGLIEALTGRSLSNGGCMIDMCFAKADRGVPTHKWEWVHVRKKD